MSRSLRVDQVHIGTVKAAVRARFHTQRELSEELGVALATVSNFLNGKPVDRAIFEELCTRLLLHWKDVAAPLEESSPPPAMPVTNVDRPATQQDWGEAPEVSTFYGRMDELATLTQWITVDRCRLIVILGMGGMGKTTLAVKLAEQIQGEFEYVIWRSLLNAPPIEELLQELIQFLSNQQEIHLPDTLEGRLSRLIQYLNQHRCLVLLDNFESTLQSGTCAGHYNSEYEGYGRLLQRMSESSHQSCVLLTSREKPKDVSFLEGIDAPVRSLQLKGLTQSEGWEIFKSKGCYGADDRELQEVFEHYAGNPLALRIVASGIQELAEGDIAELLPYLRQGEFQFGDINDLLKRQFERLSLAEQQVMYWLAINREPVTLAELEADIVSDLVRRQLLDAVQSLIRRCLVERTTKQLSLQPVVMEYITYQLIAGVCNEVVKRQQTLLRHYALLKAQSKDYIRQAQIRLIIQPILTELTMKLGSMQAIEQQFKDLLVMLRQEAPLQPGYVGGNVLNLLGELNADLSGLDCSSLCIWQAYLIDKTLHQVNFANADFSKSVFADALSATLGLAFSPDGQFFAAGNSDGLVRVWRTTDGQKHLTLVGHHSWVTSVSFSPNGQLLASSSFDHTVKLWNLTTGQCLRTLSGHTNWVWYGCFSPDGQTLVSSSADCTVRLWNAKTGECLRVLEGHTSTVWYAKFSLDGRWVASGAGGDDRTIRLWDVQTGQTLKEFQNQGWVRSVIFTPDGRWLISSSSDSVVRIWDIATATCIRHLQGHSSTVTSLALSSDAQTLASGGQDTTVRIWDIASGQCLNTLRGHPNGVWTVAFHPDKETLISGSNDSMIKLWNVRTGQSVRTLTGYDDGIRTIAFNSKQQLLASGGNDKKLKLWDIQSGECIKTITGHKSWIWSTAFSQDGRILATASSDQTVRLWHVDTGKPLHVLYGHTNLVMSVAFSIDDRLLASGCSDQTVRIWDVETGQCLETLQHPGQIWSVACGVYPDRAAGAGAISHILASGGDDKVVRLWHIPSGKCFKILEGHDSAVWSIAFSPDGQMLASGCHDRTIRLWDVQSGQCLRILTCDGRIWSVRFSADGQQLVSGSDGKTVSLWDVQSGECLVTMVGHIGEIYTATFLENQSMIASSGQDGMIRLWDSQTGDLIKTLRDNRPYEHMNITGITGLTTAQKATLCNLGAIEV
ncbi:WD40 domain-containing protein [Thermocoleostomius sinensis]|uniref:NB-ARC domain-containing protein n=1 Tax=Thermocoleostomius sinensis A174 TaxID=2016057 RepID=A0A9E8ZEG0_9CYAN|nr:NB-ARC domain-containing protein [Thermocoleostomius sinensis]WAL61492.1 NB-ARC domain-containing protein [Thermocoleostomius sinensis A174]